MEGTTLLPPTRSAPPTHVPSVPIPNQSVASRGTPVTLPPDFLRLPSQQQHPPGSSFSRMASGSQDYLTLFSDPNFLAEMEREFGPDFEAVLREHLQAEALRNTSNYSQYSDSTGQSSSQQYMQTQNTQSSPQQWNQSVPNSAVPPPAQVPQARASRPLEGVFFCHRIN